MEKVFILEDSSTIFFALNEIIQKHLDVEVVWAKSLEQAKSTLHESPATYAAAVVDLVLPDASNGFDGLDLLLEQGVPCIVYTSTIDEQLRYAIWDKGIADYVIKGDERSVEYLVSMIERLRKNPSIKTLIVDDSPLVRQLYGQLLTAHNYQVFAAESGEEALGVLKEHPDIKLALVDYVMPGMDGVALTAAIRRTHSKNELAVIALSGQDKEEVSVRFIKSGANDYIDKRMSHEGFYCRISHHIEMLEKLQLLRESGYRDYLTGAYNRRYFFEAGHGIFADAVRTGRNMALAMLDIDHFKRINDKWGHDAGDAVLKCLAKILMERFRASDLVARFGGEEFCILIGDVAHGDAFMIFEELRQQIERSVVPHKVGEDANNIQFTVSIGICCERLNDLESMITVADELLYAAKRNGRNKIATT